MEKSSIVTALTYIILVLAIFILVLSSINIALKINIWLTVTTAFLSVILMVASFVFMGFAIKETPNHNTESILFLVFLSVLTVVLMIMIVIAADKNYKNRSDLTTMKNYLIREKEQNERIDRGSEEDFRRMMQGNLEENANMPYEEWRPRPMTPEERDGYFTGRPGFR